jgi:hypothetical protein
MDLPSAAEGLEEFKTAARHHRNMLSKSLRAASTAFRRAPGLENSVRTAVAKYVGSIKDVMSSLNELCEQLPPQEKLLVDVHVTEQVLPVLFGYKTAVADRILELRGEQPQSEF